MSAITQEVEFGRKVESVAIWHKSVVALVLWFNVVDGQFVDPTKGRAVRSPEASPYIYSV